MLWILSEICYYLGLLLAALILPALTFSLWMMSLVGKAEPAFAYLLLAWLIALGMFGVGVWIKNSLSTQRDKSGPN